MSEFVITLIFLAIGGLFWVIKTAAAIRAHRDAGQEYAGQSAGGEFDEEFEAEPPDLGQGFHGFGQEFAHKPEKHPRIEPPAHRPAPAPAPPAAAVRPKAPAPKKKTPARRKNLYAAWLKSNTRNAILVREVLGPPKSLR